MGVIHYRNFDIQVRRAAKGFSVEVRSNEAGEAKTEFELPFSEDELQRLRAELGATSVLRDLQPASQASGNAAKRLGGQLFHCAFAGPIGNAFARSIEAATQTGEGLRIRLRLTDVPELASLPWEYLHEERRGFLSLYHKTSIVRYLEVPQAVASLTVKPPLRVLVMAASPHRYDRLSVETEWKSLQTAFGNLPRGLAEIERLEKATLSALQERLSKGDPVHVFHYIGHGGVDPKSGVSELVMEDEHHYADLVDGQRLSVVLQNHDSLRLVLLNACEGAAASVHDVFTGVAQSLIRQQLPATIAMQFKITDTAAVTLAKTFYEMLACGHSVDAAIAEARIAVFAQRHNVEWGTPVLYLRSDDGHLFDVDTPPPDPAQPKSSPSTVQNTLPSEAVKLPRGGSLTGAMDSSSPFYIERECEREALEAITESGGITLAIQAVGQSGASSLLARLRETATRAGKEVIHLNFQGAFDPSDFTNTDDFHRRFCVMLANLLNKEERVADYWNPSLSISYRCTRYLESLLRSMGEKSLLLAMDEVDRLIVTEFRSSFFGVLRAWHSERAGNALFRRLDLVIVTSLEPNQLIDDPDQSNFNVSQNIKLDDFTLEEARRLNTAYGSPLTEAQLHQLHQLIGGHPRLWQQSLHRIRKSYAPLSGDRFDSLLREAKKDSGLFGSHLSAWHDFLQKHEALREALIAILSGRKYEWKDFLILRKQGLVRREGTTVQARCKLYEEYFKEHFHV